MRLPLALFTLIVSAITVPTMAAQKVELSIDASKTGAKIDRNIFGQFAEHLGHGIYERHLGRARFQDPEYARDSQRCCWRLESDQGAERSLARWLLRR